MLTYIKDGNEYHSKLKVANFQKFIKVLLIDNITLLQKVNNETDKDSSAKISTIRNYIKDQIFIPKFDSNEGLQNDQLGYINLYELLDDAAAQIFDYFISINGIKIISKGTLNSNSPLLPNWYKIADDLICEVFVQLNPEGAYVKEVSKRENQQIKCFLIILNLTLFSLILPGYYCSKKYSNLRNKLVLLSLELEESLKRSKEIIRYYEKNKEFTLRCYRYFKNNVYENTHLFLATEPLKIDSENEEIFPLPIAVKQKKTSSLNKILIQPIITDIHDYFNGYIALYKIKLILEIKASLETIIVPFQPEEFYQIIISLFCNIIHFNQKKEDSNYIKLHFEEKVITFSCNGFLLNHNLTVKYSKKIFTDTGNVYLMSLGQIYVLFKTNNLEYTVNIQGQETIFRFMLEERQKSADKSGHTENNIINLQNFSKKI